MAAPPLCRVSPCPMLDGSGCRGRRKNRIEALPEDRHNCMIPLSDRVLATYSRPRKPAKPAMCCTIVPLINPEYRSISDEVPTRGRHIVPSRSKERSVSANYAKSRLVFPLGRDRARLCHSQGPATFSILASSSDPTLRYRSASE